MAFSSLLGEAKTGLELLPHESDLFAFPGSTLGTVSGPDSMPTWKGGHRACVLEATRQGRKGLRVAEGRTKAHLGADTPLAGEQPHWTSLQSTWKAFPRGLRRKFPRCVCDGFQSYELALLNVL